jgi:hypothetical protein
VGQLPLPQYKDGDLPPLPGSFWQLVGPGAVLVGLAIGAGELIVWPRVTAQYGAVMTWAAMLGVFIQTWLNLEIGRYTLATGESVYAGFARISRVLPWLFIALNIAGWIVPGWARTCGGALKVIVVGPDGGGSPTLWTAITFVGVAIVLFGPRMAYSAIEVTVETLVVLKTIALIVVALSVANADVWWELGRGIINVGHKAAAMPSYELFSSIVFAGAGGTANLFFSFYIRDKGWGMGARMPSVINPLRGREEKTSSLGFRIRDTAENRRLWHAWMRHLTWDQAFFFWFLNSFTILLFVVASLAVLRPLGIVPSQELLVYQEAVILESSWGTAGKYLFLAVGVACLFSTQLTLVDGVSRSIADILHTNFSWARTTAVGIWYRRIAISWIVIGITLTYLYESIPPIMFLLSAGFCGGIAMAIYAPLMMLLNWRFLPSPFRPSPARMAILAVVSSFYVCFAIVATMMLLQRIFA